MERSWRGGGAASGDPWQRDDTASAIPCSPARPQAAPHNSLVIGMPAVNSSVRMAGGQCPPKGGQLTTTTAMRELVNQLTSELTIDHHR